MSKELRIRKPWKILFLPFNILGTLAVWILFDVTLKQAWRGEL
jgi:hypothetical protein